MSNRKPVVDPLPRISPGARDRPEIVKLIASPQFREISRLLAGRPVSPALRHSSLEEIIIEAALDGLRAPSYHETLTKGQRQKMGADISKAALTLKLLLTPMMEKDNIFQPEFDSMACDYAVDEYDKMKAAGKELDEDTVNSCRFSVYSLLMEGLPDLLDVISETALGYADQDTILKQPNDLNAPRLFFIRRVTNFFGMVYKSPMRAATLALTSVYFNCDGLTEAALSTIAKWKRRKPIELSPEAREQIRSFFVSQGVPEYWDDLEKAREEAKEFYEK